jgi:hypothetical protein
MLGLLTWSGGFVTYYPSSGWDFYASTQETATMVVLAVLFGMLLPLEVAAIGKARSAAGSAGGLLGTVFGILSMSCCAPLILPALLSFIGFSGMTLLQVNIAVHEWVTPLTLASIGFMLVAIALVSRTITEVCALPPRRGITRQPLPWDWLIEVEQILVNEGAETERNPCFGSDPRSAPMAVGHDAGARKRVPVHWPLSPAVSGSRRMTRT